MRKLTTEREYHFEHAGFQCEVMLMTCGAFPDWYCGYVSIPEGHPWHGKPYHEIDADVHGGLTYGQWSDGRWVIGFDTNHYGDGPKERSFEYCVEETRRLAAQAAQSEEAAKQ